MIGEQHVSIPHVLDGLGHLFNGVMAVRPIGVNVEVPFQILPLHQMGELARLGRLDLPLVLPKLRGNPAKPQGPVDLLLFPAGDSSISPDSKHPVLIDRQTLAVGQRPDFDVVGLGTGGVNEGRPEGAGLHHPKIHLNPLGGPDAGFGLTVCLDRGDELQLHKPIHHLGRTPGGHQDVQIPHCFLSAAQAPGHDNSIHLWNGFKRLEDLLAQGKRHPQGHPLLAGLDQANPPEDVLLLLFAKAGEGPQLPGLDQFLQLLDGFHPETVIEKPGGLGAHPGDRHQGHEALRDLLLEPIQECQVPRGEVLLNLGGQIFANSWDGPQGLPGGQGLQIGGQAP